MEQENVMVYIDNSNIFSATQKFSARKKRFFNRVRDVNCRVNVGGLVQLAIGGRHLIHGKLYGSEPPALDTVWAAIRKEQIEVHKSKRSEISNREKKVDTGLVSAATRDVVKKADEAGDYRTMILFSGDSDMLPVVIVALQEGWKVEIWSYDSALNNEYRDMARRNKLLKIFKIDDYFEQVTFQEPKWSGHFPKERTMVLRLKESVPIDTRSKRMTHQQYGLLKNVIDKAIFVFHLPFMGKYLIQDQERETSELALVICCPETKYFEKTNEEITFFDFNEDIWSIEKKGHFETMVNGKLITLIEYLDIKKDYTFDYQMDDEDWQDFVNDLDHFDTSAADDFKLVLTKKTRKSQKYSDLCKYDFTCALGVKCSYAHRDCEKEFFKEHIDMKPKNRRYYKSKQCIYSKNKQCKYDRMDGKLYLCPFVHDESEKRCLWCKAQGIHWSDECDIPREEKGIREYFRTK